MSNHNQAYRYDVSSCPIWCLNLFAPTLHKASVMLLYKISFVACLLGNHKYHFACDTIKDKILHGDLDTSLSMWDSLNVEYRNNLIMTRSFLDIRGVTQINSAGRASLELMNTIIFRVLVVGFNYFTIFFYFSLKSCLIIYHMNDSRLHCA